MPILSSFRSQNPNQTAFSFTFRRIQIICEKKLPTKHLQTPPPCGEAGPGPPSCTSGHNHTPGGPSGAPPHASKRAHSHASRICRPADPPGTPRTASRPERRQSPFHTFCIAAMQRIPAHPHLPAPAPPHFVPSPQKLSFQYILFVKLYTYVL